MKQRWILLMTAAVLAGITGCAPAGKAVRGSNSAVRISGEDASISSFLMPVKDIFEEENSGVVLDIVHSRHGAELAQLVRGEVDAVISTHSLDDLLHSAAAEQVPVDPTMLQSVEVGRNDTVVLLNNKNSVKKLTKKELKGIFNGSIHNWKQLNGANRGIVVVWNVAPTTDQDAFVKEILDGEKFVPKAVTVYTYEEVRKLVAELPEAIGVAPSVYAAASVNVPNSPKVSSPVILVTKGAPSRQVSSLMEILKEMALLQ